MKTMKFVRRSDVVATAELPEEVKNDLALHVAGLLDEVREYAQIYLLARQRHKGCEGTGELMTLNEEFGDVPDK